LLRRECVDLPLDFKELLAEFASSKVEAVIVGGYAVAFHGRPRTTKDIDLVLEPSPENLDRAAEALDRFGAPPVVVEGVRCMQPTEVVFFGQPPLRIDFLRTIDGVTTETLFANAVTTTLDHVPVRVISLPDLISNKRAAARPQDLLDAAYLERVQAKRSQK
jgi:predicted nucleotidyltransferase